MSSAPVAAIILAAGQGTRMKSDLPKVLHEACGRPMALWVVRAAQEAGADRIVTVIGNGADLVRESLSSEPLEFVEQTERLGTAHATQQATPLLGDFQGSVLVLAGDTPLLSGATLASLVKQQQESGAKCVLATFSLDDPTGYGRILRDGEGKVTGIVEHKDASEEQRAIKEVNPAVYCFDGPTLFRLLPQVKNDNAQGEYYLPDVISMIASEGAGLDAVHFDDADEFLGVNDRWQLAAAAGKLNQRILKSHAMNGVHIVDPHSTWIGGNVQIGAGTTILPGCFLQGKVVMGQDNMIGPHCFIRDAQIGNGCHVFMSHMNQCRITDEVRVGPFANIRPKALLEDRVKVGNYVEVKNATLHEDVSVSHLTYLGDAEIGARTNIGAGTITCNYDGFNKHITKIGQDTFVGSNSTLVAPLNIGDEAMVAAGSVVNRDVPDGAMTIGRGKQEIKEEWFKTWRKRKLEQQSTEKGR
ncbi:MAG: bifunctional UDP-N-acetylglucosamine diphosphorylase/glucosamine-1-phosphate N-acetyltransferase GlmU [Armatimonadetes bacterium]|nr:bifunctional UDP-N-acetylglucosamine diphosphorylase/glucosamine-1-phosphate N-acetyltransferase GlmU [Armatimonadota bacterium]